MKSITDSPVLLPAAYFGTVGYWACLMAFPHIIIEAHEHYVKQTLRNRTTILTEGGPQTLTVPVASALPSPNRGIETAKHGDAAVDSGAAALNSESVAIGGGAKAFNKGALPSPASAPNIPKTKQSVCDILISSHGNWPHLHLQALRSAYDRSPFFEYYIDDLLPLYDSPAGQSLLDFDMRTLNTVCDLMGFHPSISLSAAYDPAPDCVDLRSAFSASTAENLPFIFTSVPYYQVFRNRFGFVPNLSILDLLFNMGPEALVVLRNSVR